MSFYIRHRFGGNDRDPPLEALAALLTEFDEDPGDVEHDSVSVVHESDWAIAAHAGGLVTLEDVEDLDKEPRHMVVDEREKVLQLFRAVAEGRLAEVFAEPWQPGYGTPPTPDSGSRERAREGACTGADARRTRRPDEGRR